MISLEYIVWSLVLVVVELPLRLLHHVIGNWLEL